MPEATTRSLMLALTAVMAALLCAPATAPGKALQPHEIVSSELWQPGPERVRAELVRIPGSHLADLAIVTPNAPGRTNWPSRAPRGEAGRLNHCAFPENAPINRIAPLGKRSRSVIDPLNPPVMLDAVSHRNATGSQWLYGYGATDPSFVYYRDALNRLRAVEDRSTGPLLAEYSYDSTRRRIEKRLYDAVGTTLPIPIYDTSGNVIALVDASSGQVVAEFAYDPFGNTISSSQIVAGRLDDCPFRSSTKYFDEETANDPAPNDGVLFGTYYYGYRHYDPPTASWLSRDPLGEAGGLNLYGFVGNDPVNKFDYLGLDYVRIERKIIDGEPMMRYLDVDTSWFRADRVTPKTKWRRVTARDGLFNHFHHIGRVWRYGPQPADAARTGAIMNELGRGVMAVPLAQPPVDHGDKIAIGMSAMLTLPVSLPALAWGGGAAASGGRAVLAEGQAFATWATNAYYRFGHYAPALAGVGAEIAYDYPGPNPYSILDDAVKVFSKAGDVAALGDDLVEVTGKSLRNLVGSDRHHPVFSMFLRAFKGAGYNVTTPSGKLIAQRLLRITSDNHVDVLHHAWDARHLARPYLQAKPGNTAALQEALETGRITPAEILDDLEDFYKSVHGVTDDARSALLKGLETFRAETSL